MGGWDFYNIKGYHFGKILKCIELSGTSKKGKCIEIRSTEGVTKITKLYFGFDRSELLGLKLNKGPGGVGRFLPWAALQRTVSKKEEDTVV